MSINTYIDKHLLNAVNHYTHNENETIQKYNKLHVYNVSSFIAICSVALAAMSFLSMAPASFLIFAGIGAVCVMTRDAADKSMSGNVLQQASNKVSEISNKVAAKLNEEEAWNPNLLTFWGITVFKNYPPMQESH